MLIMVDSGKLSFEKTIRIKDLLDEYEKIKEKMIESINNDMPFLVKCWFGRLKEIMDELESLGVEFNHTNDLWGWAVRNGKN
ncbi:hypothetical protein D307_gp041 [Bacillus phage Bastille]|uniref:Uncharacterized protein n=1 Tax=Bacillus phage Bastille TaxID=57477 RepID=J9PL41_9CAUD|nr:hypothetical protein D307_gp041 [Bacillus phage Bastille]AEQ34423.1 hypothetical protein [Bacillus phage Bastille]AZF89122.1 hypothetical protein Goe5_c00140 [Bacillus phage vB_BthM-Goe5]